MGAVLLSGNGKSFCAGMDLHEVLAPSSGDVNEVHERIFTAGIRMTKPLIAAVHGAALAGGTGLAANCHIVIAADDATFGLTEIRIGLWPFVIFRTIVAALGLYVPHCGQVTITLCVLHRNVTPSALGRSQIAQLVRSPVCI